MPRAPRMTPDEWQASTVSNLAHADGTHHGAVDTVLDSLATVKRTNTEYGRQRDVTNHRFFQKIENTKELSQQLSTRIRCVNQAIEHSEWSAKKLWTSMQALVRPAELCRSRIAQRQKRPKRELVMDPFQEALAHEEQELGTAKARLTEAFQETQRLIRELQSQRAALEADLQDKQHALATDMLCVDRKTAYKESALHRVDKSYHRAGVPLKAVLPEILGTPRSGMDDTDGRAQEALRQKATLKNVERAAQLEEAAKERWKASNQTMESCLKAVTAAHKQTQLEMGAKVEHTELLRQELMKQRKATEQKMHETQRCLALAAEKLSFIQKPINANSERHRIRAGRTPREATSDQVTEALKTQQIALRSQEEQLQNQVTALQRNLDELHRALRHLEEDIFDKDRAIAIDRGCSSSKDQAHRDYSYGFSKVGHGQRHFADTASSKKRQVSMPVSPTLRRG